MAMCYVKLFYDWESFLTALSDAEAGALFKALLAWGARQERLPLEDRTDGIFRVLKTLLDRDRRSCLRAASAFEKEGGKGEEKEYDQDHEEKKDHDEGEGQENPEEKDHDDEGEGQRKDHAHDEGEGQEYPDEKDLVYEERGSKEDHEYGQSASGIPMGLKKPLMTTREGQEAPCKETDQARAQSRKPRKGPPPPGRRMRPL